MRPLVIALVLGCAGHAHAGFDGFWFQCKSDWQAADNFVLLEVRHAASEWGAEWGVAYSANGTAEQDASGDLVLRGCSTWRGQAQDACDVQHPPVLFVLPRKAMQQPARATQAALRRQAWIRTDGDSWKALARRCAALKASG